MTKSKSIRKGPLERIEKLKEVVELQCSDGVWNYDPYMHGMANGMILCLALMQGDDVPKFLEAPDVWLYDKRCDEPNASDALKGGGEE